MHASQCPGQGFSHSHNFGSDHTKTSFAPVVRFNARDISRSSIDNFLAKMNYDQLCDLTERVCDHAGSTRPGDWKDKRLREDFKRHDIEYLDSGHSKVGSKKKLAVLNLMLDLKRDSGQKASKDGKPLFERFCALLQDTQSVFIGGQELLVAEIGKSVAAPVFSPEAGSMPVTGEVLRPEASAPPAYDDVVRKQDIATRLADVNSRIVQLLEATPTPDFDAPEVLEFMSWLQTELAFISSCQADLDDDLSSQLQKAQHGWEALKENQQVFRETEVIKNCSEKLNELENSLNDTVRNAESASKVNEIERELERLVDQLTGLVVREDDKRNLQSRGESLGGRISSWRASVAAGDCLACLIEEVAAISADTSSQDLATLSGRLLALKNDLDGLPSDEFRTDLQQRWQQVHDQLTKTVAGRQQPLPEVEEDPLESSVGRVNSDISNYAGRVSGKDIGAVMGALSNLLGNLSKVSSDTSAATVTSPHAAVSAGVKLTTLATGLNMSRTNLYRGQHVNASIGLDVTPSQGHEIVPVLLSDSLDYDQLPLPLKRRLSEACPGQCRPSTVSLVHVFMIADDRRAFDGASFKISLISQMRAGYGALFNNPLNKSLTRQYSPVAIALSLPERLVQNASFFKSSWSLHEDRVGDDVVNLPYAWSESGAIREDIGLAQLQPIIKAAGGDDALASSLGAGMAIPFGVQISRQSDQVIRSLEQTRCVPKRGMGYPMSVHRGFGSESVTRGFFHGGDMEPEALGPVDSGIVPMALTSETAVEISQRKSPDTVVVNGAGLVSVRTVSGINVRNGNELRDWVRNKVSDFASGGLKNISVL